MRVIRRIVILLCLFGLCPAQLAAQDDPHGKQPDTLTLLNPTDVVRPADYPVAALRDGAQGSVSILLTADARGMLRDCRIMQSSGTRELDERTCALMRARGQFRIAAIPGGRRDLYTMHERVRWVIARDTVPAPEQSLSAESRQTLLILTGLVSWMTLAGVVLVPPVSRPILSRRIVTVPFTVLVITPGMIVMLMVADCYPLFWPFITGAFLAVAFTVLAMALTWLWLRGTGSGMTEDIVVRIMLCLTVGALYVQPLVLLVNGHGQGAEPRLVPGVVRQTYRTHGKGAANYIVLDGPAAAYGNTMSDGEFKVDADTYGAISMGEHVCVMVHTGLLHMHWWSLATCPLQSQRGRGDERKPAAGA